MVYWSLYWLLVLAYKTNRGDVNISDLEKIKLTDIKPSEYNPRRISEKELTKLENSIREFGVVDPIIINLANDNTIIGGHQRYDILLKEYLDNKKDNDLNLIRLGDIGWVFKETELNIPSEDYEKALNIALNNISGEWDNPKIETILNDLDLDISLTGFSEEDIEDIQFNSEFESYVENQYSDNPVKSSNVGKVKFIFGKYIFKIPYDEYTEWEDNLRSETENNEDGDIIQILTERLGI